jgi:hypothetical protein
MCRHRRGSSGSGQGLQASSTEHGNGSSGFIKAVNFLTLLSVLFGSQGAVCCTESVRFELPRLLGREGSDLVPLSERDQLPSRTFPLLLCQVLIKFT